MKILLLAIELYFAATLGVAGLAKIDRPARFAATLRQQRVFPAWSIGSIGRIFPWVEIALSIALVAGIAPLLTGAATLALFVGFLILKAYLFLSKSHADCGCFAAIYEQKLENASHVVVGVVWVALAAFHLWGVTWATPVGTTWRLASVVLFASTGCGLVWKMVSRRRVAMLQQSEATG